MTVASSTAKLHFSRYEFKYLLPKALRDELEKELNYFLTLDPYVSQKPEKKYFVRSLYFDDESFSNYYEKTDGMHDRLKFRIRTYSQDVKENCALFLEIKGKQGELVYKHRSPIKASSSDYTLINKADMLLYTLKHTEQSPTLEHFDFERERKRLKPVILIDYNRRPYISKYAPDFRLTFDDSISGTRADKIFPSPQNPTRSILRGHTVMEVKFNHHMPSWFHRVIQAYELKRVSISKYCKGIEVFKLTPNLE